MTDFPEHDKLLGLNGANQIVGEFIEWLSENDMAICSRHSQGYFPISKGRDKLLSEFFDINEDELEIEKRRILSRLND